MLHVLLLASLCLWLAAAEVPWQTRQIVHVAKPDVECEPLPADAGILKAFVGLSGSVFTTVYMGAFKPHMMHFLLFLAVAPPLLGLCLVGFVNAVPPRSAPRAPLPAIRQGVLSQAAGGGNGRGFKQSPMLRDR